MNCWALLKNGKIVNTVTTTDSKRMVQNHYREYVVRDFDSLPTDVQEAYRYWNERP